MARHWLRRNSDNVLIGMTDDDALAALGQTGHTYVAESAIRAVRATGAIVAGDTFDGTTYTVRVIAPADLVQSRRATLFIMLRGWAETPGFAVTNIKNSARSAIYDVILEARARAILVDANLSDDTRFNTIRTELRKSAERFLFKFDSAAWSTGQGAPYPVGSTPTVWWTSADLYADDTASNAGGTLDSTISLATGPVDWLAETWKFS